MSDPVLSPAVAELKKICSRMLYGIACGTRGWVYISSHGVGYDIPSLSARYCCFSTFCEYV